jgi:hypothetical protein
MHGDKVVGGGLEAGLDAHVALVVDVPCAGVADHIAVAGMSEHRTLPEGLGQRIEAQRLVEALAVADQLLRSRCCAPSESRPGRRASGRRAARPRRRCCPTPAPTYCPAGARGSCRRVGARRRRTSRSACGGRRCAARDRAVRPASTAARCRPETLRESCRTASARARRCRQSPARARPGCSARPGAHNRRAWACRRRASPPTGPRVPLDRGSGPSSGSSSSMPRQ